MRFHKTLLATASLPLLIAVSSAEAADDSTSNAKTIAPYIDEGTIAVGRLDLTKIDVPAAVKRIHEIVPLRPQQLAAGQKAAMRFLTLLREQKVTEVYGVFSLTDFPQGGVFVIVPVGEGGDHRKVAGLMYGANPDGPTSHRESRGRRGMFEVCAPLDGVVACGRSETIKRLRTLKASPRRHLATAFNAVNGDTIQAAFVPSKDHHRVIAEMMPKLPQQFGGIDGRDVVHGVQWAALGIQLPPKLQAELIIASADRDAAARMKTALLAGVRLLENMPPLRRFLPEAGTLRQLLTPTVTGKQLHWTFDAAQEPGRKLLALLATAVQDAQGAARRTQSKNSLKQLGIAMHNFHDVHKSFPPHASFDKKGQRLLSWRVYLLPYLGGLKLFEQFHLDEPWDSPHNKKLIAKMPKVFADPSGKTDKPGRTRYLAPIGAKTIFDGKAEGIAIRRITDGTSNTILFVEAAPENAVIWTKPEDLQINPKAPKKGLLGKEAKGFYAAFADGSVRFIAASIKPGTLNALFTRNGREVVNEIP